MARFLSPEWLAQLGAAAGSDRHNPATDGTGGLTVRQVVVGGPDGDVTYTVRLRDGSATVMPGDGPADIEVVQDYATAVAISKGQLTPAAAFAAGRLKLGGRVGLLVRHDDAAHGLGDLFGPLRADTSY